MATIRLRRKEDAQALVTLLKKVHAHSGYPVIGTECAAEFIYNKESLEAWVAELDGQVVGHASVDPCDFSSPPVTLWLEQGGEKNIAGFNRLFVDPACQGKGIAKQLVTTVQDYGHKHELRLLLYVVERFSAIRALYEKFGWIYYAESVFRYGEGESMISWCYASPI